MKKISFVLFLSFSLLFLFVGITKVQAASISSGDICDDSNKGKNGLVPCGNASINLYQYSFIKVINHIHTYSISAELFPALTNNCGDCWNAAARGCESAEGYVSWHTANCNNPTFTTTSARKCNVICTVNGPETITTSYTDTAGSIDELLANHPGAKNPTLIGSKPKCPCQLAHMFILILNIYNYIILISTALAAGIITLGGVLMIVSRGPTGSSGLYSRAKTMVLWSVIAVFLILGSYLIINIVLTAIGYQGAWSGF